MEFGKNSYFYHNLPGLPTITNFGGKKAIIAGPVYKAFPILYVEMEYGTMGKCIENSCHGAGFCWQQKFWERRLVFGAFPATRKTNY